MNYYLIFSALLIIITGFIHSVLGEKLIIIPLLKIDLPPLSKSPIFMKRVLRFAWHLTTVTWWGIGFFLIQLSMHPLDAIGLLFIKMMIVMCIISGLISLIVARGRHFVWIVFFVITYLLWKA